MRTLSGIAVVVCFGVFVLQACGSNCKTHDQHVCAEGITYWIDSCGNREEVAETCDCGCNGDYSGCKDNCPCVPDSGIEIPYDGKDNDCNEATPDDDLDEDGYPLEFDCDDTNAQINPDWDEYCDSVDNNCDGQTDEGYLIGQPCESLGLCGPGVYECDVNTYSICSTAPGGSDDKSNAELCNDMDDDCDGETDEDFAYNEGRIGDNCIGVGMCGLGIVECESESSTTCSSNPGGSNDQSLPECCDSFDNDCDGLTDEGMPDVDNDGYSECTDCDDDNPAVNPGANEMCNGIDDECDGETDEGLDTDADGDNHYTIDSCSQPNDDCDDTDPTVNPEAEEILQDGIDNDCNSLTPDDPGQYPPLVSIRITEAIMSDGSPLADPCDMARSDAITLEGRVMDPYGDDIDLSSVLWIVEERPDGGFRQIVPSADPFVATFATQLAGEYVICLQASDITGNQSTYDPLLACTCSEANVLPDNQYDCPCVRFSAAPREDIWIELVWNNLGPDLDLHLLAPGASVVDDFCVPSRECRFDPVSGDPWNRTACVEGATAQTCMVPDCDPVAAGCLTDQECYDDGTGPACWWKRCSGRDCYWGGRNPDWGVLGDEADDPNLEIDCTDGCRVENISLNRPEPGTYQILVNYYEPNRSWTDATVRIFFKDDNAPTAEFITRMLDPCDTWNVAILEWTDPDNHPVTYLGDSHSNRCCE